MKIVASALLFLVFCLSANVASGRSQVKLQVVEIENIKAFPVPHLLTEFDRKIRFRLTNCTGKSIKVYGSLNETGLQPMRYFLVLDEKTSTWKYPTSDGKPIKWKAESSIYKKFEILNQGESLEFDWFLSSKQDRGKNFKISIQISVGKSKRTYEIQSEEFMLAD